MKRASLLLPAALLLTLPAGAAFAQGIGGSPPPAARQAAPQLAPAPALPGLAGRRAPAPIEAEPGQNLSPNAALFDAINRGDLAAVRDAVARGADLGARNQLGLTPLDAAVDQGRTEISFYLLSAREPSRGAEPPGQANLGGPPSSPARRSPARREAASGEGAPTSGSSALAAQATLAASAAARNQASAPRGARLWAGDGGTPRPEIGFLGFDAGRPPGAVAPVSDEATPVRRRGRG